MLIQCERHTDKDIDLWKEHEEVDLLNYTLLNIKSKTERAIEILTEFAPDYFSISWGKDSVVLAHLAWGFSKKSVLAHFTHVADALYFNDVRDCFLFSYPIQYHEFSKEIGRVDEFFDFHALQIKKQASVALGKRYVTGIRTQESPERKITVRKNGLISGNSCRPIARWTTDDIFAYLAHHNLPVHPNYAMLGGGRYERNSIRVGPMWMGSQKGKEMWEKEYYGDVLRKLQLKILGGTGE